VIDDSGFKHLTVKVVAPSLEDSVDLLDRMFENPDVSTTLRGAGIVDGRPFFELDIFGASSQVEEVLTNASKTAGKARQSSLEALGVHV
jgi:hypothetical protein